MDDSLLPRLERAELAAREVGLAATAEATHILEIARAEAQRIADEVPDRIGAAIAARRAALLAEAQAEVAAIEFETASGVTAVPHATVRGPPQGRLDAAGLPVVPAGLGGGT